MTGAKAWTNPLRDPGDKRLPRIAGPCGLVIFGVTGDLSNPEWGSMIGLERNQLFNAPHIILAPGLAITLTVLGFNLLGDGLRDALDPRLNR